MSTDTAEPPRIIAILDEDGFPLTLETITNMAIEAAIARARGNITEAARQLAVGRQTIYRRKWSGAI